MGVSADATADPWIGPLDKTERLIWQGRPDGRFRVDMYNIAPSLFGIVFMAVGIFELVYVQSFESGLTLFGAIPAAFAVTFLLFGLHLVLGIHLGRTYDRRNTRYALTDQRAIVALNRFRTPIVTSFAITAEMEIELRTTEPPSVLFADRYIELEDETERQRIGFELLGDAQKVYDLMLQVQRGKA